MSKIMVAPSILSGDFAKLGDTVASVEAWGADMVHCDIMDGGYVPNLTFGMPFIKAVRSYAKIPFDVHLMILKPEKFIQQFIDAGADIITFHPETSECVDECLDLIHKSGKKGGLVLNPNIPFDVIKPYMQKIDLIEVMGVYAGFGGQKFIRETLDKLREAKKAIDKTGREIWLEIDGGVSLSNFEEILDAGANLLVAGSAVFGSADPAKTIKLLRREKF